MSVANMEVANRHSKQTNYPNTTLFNKSEKGKVTSDQKSAFTDTGTGFLPEI